MFIESISDNDFDILTSVSKITALLMKKHNEPPKLLLIMYSLAGCSLEIFELFKKSFPESNIFGVSSFNGVISDYSNSSFSNDSIGVMAFYDFEGEYGCESSFMSSSASIDDNILYAINNAENKANRVGELPKMVYFISSRNIETKAISIIESRYGKSVPICGGVPGFALNIEKSCFCNGNIHINDDFFAVILFYPSCEIATHFETMYVPLDYQGIITMAHDNVIVEINNHIALDYYLEWINHYVPIELFVDEKTGNYCYADFFTSYPIGVQLGSDSNISSYQIFHIDETNKNKELISVNKLHYGDKITLMTRRVKTDYQILFQNLIRNNYFDINKDNILGILNTTCQSYHSFLVNDDLDFIKNLDIPILGLWASGEHGKYPNGDNRESSLMFNNILFYEPTYSELE